MAELHIDEHVGQSFNELNYSATRDGTTGIWFPEKGKGPDWYIEVLRTVATIINAVRPLAPLRVYRDENDGDLQFSVAPGEYEAPDGTVATYPGSSQNNLTDNATNYIYLAPDGTLVVNTTGFPSSGGYLPLATITCADGMWKPDDLVDKRPVYRFKGLTDSPTLAISVGPESGDVIPVTIQVQDVAGQNLSGRFEVHAWLSDSQYGGETAGTPEGLSVATGTLLKEETPNKRLRALTDANGTLVLNVSEASAVTYYLNAQINGKVFASDPITFA